jgi:hypothetical protein
MTDNLCRSNLQFIVDEFMEMFSLETQAKQRIARCQIVETQYSTKIEGFDKRVMLATTCYSMINIIEKTDQRETS